MIERIGIGVSLDLDHGQGLDLSIDQGQGLDLNIDQGRVLVHAQKGKSCKDPQDSLYRCALAHNACVCHLRKSIFCFVKMVGGCARGTGIML